MVLSEDAQARVDSMIPSVWPQFILVWDEAPIARGLFLLEGVAARVDGPQIRCGRGQFWITTGESWPDPNPDALAEIGVQGLVIDAIREYFEDTGRLH